MKERNQRGLSCAWKQLQTAQHKTMLFVSRFESRHSNKSTSWFFLKGRDTQSKPEQLSHSTAWFACFISFFLKLTAKTQNPTREMICYYCTLHKIILVAMSELGMALTKTVKKQQSSNKHLCIRAKPKRCNQLFCSLLGLYLPHRFITGAWKQRAF